MTSSEQELCELVRRLERHRERRVALHVRFSGLSEESRREHQLRLGSQTLALSLDGCEGQLFQLGSGDVVFVGRDLPEERLRGAVQRLNYLFGDDPMVAIAPEAMAGFVTIWRLETDYARFSATCRRFLTEARERERAAARAPEASCPRPLNPVALARLQALLARSDLGPFIRNQPVLAAAPDGRMVPVLLEYYVSIAALAAELAPGTDLLANRWLFLELTQTLDMRMLAWLGAEIGRMERNLSLNLNIATLLSPQFEELDGLYPRLRQRLVIEVQRLDAMADLGSWMFARDLLRERGYRLCLDGVTLLSLPFLGPDALGADLVKVQWDAGLAGSESARAALQQASRRLGPERLILTRCDTAEAIASARTLGLALFQGRGAEPQRRRSASG